MHHSSENTLTLYHYNLFVLSWSHNTITISSNPFLDMLYILILKLSHALNCFLRKMKYSTIEKECLAIVWALKTFISMYLYGQSYTMKTDNQPLSWLKRMKDTNGQLTRWLLLLHPYRFELWYRSGGENSWWIISSTIPTGGAVSWRSKQVGSLYC